MRVEPIKQADNRSEDFARRTAHTETEAKSTGRALVVTAPPRPVEAATPHRQAAFLAHLIATRDQAPQTRDRRRAEPSDAISAYRAAARLA